jgi:hypothetical protein
MVKRQAVVFSVQHTHYGWSVSDGSKQLGLFVTQQQALNAVKKLQAQLKAEGGGSTLVVTGHELESARSHPHWSRR